MRFDEFNIRHLRAAAAVARLGTVSSAADEINISQPAVTQALVRLENQLDEKLFKRNNEGTQTTPSGSILVQHIEAAFNHISRGFDALSRSKNAAASMPPQNLVTMPQIRALIALADNGSYIGASTATGLAQPTLHRAVQELSEITNAKITLKRGRNVSLSSKGRTLAQAFRRVRRELDQALDEIASSEGRIVGQIRVGSLPISRSKVLPAAFVALHQKYPDLGLDIVEGPYSELLERLRDGDIDILLGALRDPVPGHDVETARTFQRSAADLRGQRSSACRKGRGFNRAIEPLSVGGGARGLSYPGELGAACLRLIGQTCPNRLNAWRWPRPAPFF